MKIIVAEDEQRSREGLCRLLESMGEDCQLVGRAANGSAALDMLLQLKPDVVFTDIKMPIMDGMELIGQARVHGVRAEFVIISGYADFEFARKSISLDVAEYLLKPVTREDVERALDRVKERLEGRRSGSDVRMGRLRERYPDAHPAVLRALDIIEAAYSSRVNQRDLAGELSVSPEYFSYLFSKNVGMTFSDFLRRFRVDRAKALYASGACPRGEVPYRVGFSDAKYFSQVFRAIEGVSPAEYVKKLQ